MADIGLRRRTGLVALAAGLAGLLPCARAVAAAPAAVLARDLRNGWGVCGRPGIDASIAAYASMLEVIGTRNIRSPLLQGQASAMGRFEQLQLAMRAAGMSSPVPRMTALVTAYMNDVATTWPAQQTALLSMSETGMLQAIEGPNEINNREAGNGSHGPDDVTDKTGPLSYPANFSAWAQAIDRFRRQNVTRLRGVQVIAPSISTGLRWEYARLPDVSAFVDAANLHFYAGSGRQPSYSMRENPVVGYYANVAAWAQSAQKPAGPLWLTETGATTSGGYARDGLSQAKYIANQLFDHFAGGGTRLFFYQLIDGSSTEGDVEGNFGLFFRDGRPKPAAVLLGNLKHLLSLGTFDDPRNASDTKPVAAAYDPASLTVAGLTDAGQGGSGTLVMHKSDGSTMIAVWNEPPIDDGKGHNVAPAPISVALDFGSEQTFSIHDLLGPTPLTGRTPGGKQFDTARTTTLTLRGYPMLVELRPPAKRP